MTCNVNQLIIQQMCSAEFFAGAKIPLTPALVRRAKRGVSGRVKVLTWKGVNHPPLPSVAPLTER